MYSLQTRLLRAFGIVIIIFTVASFGLLAINSLIVSKYKQVSGSMIAEYRLTDAAKRLNEAYNSRFLSTDTNESAEDKKVQAIKQEIETLTAYLNTSIVDKQSVADYVGLKNSIHAVVEEIDGGLAALDRNDIGDASAHYAEANKKATFVTQNSATVLFDELRYASKVQAQIDRTSQLILITAYMIALGIIFGMLLYASRFAKQLVLPLKRLTGVASDISSGNLDVSVDKDLQDRRDEIGILAQSSNLMLLKLKQYIGQINQEKQNVEQKVEERTAELSKEHARLHASVNSLSLGFIMTDATMNIIMMNDVAKLILSYDIDDSGISKINKKLLTRTWTVKDLDEALGTDLDLREILNGDSQADVPLIAREIAYNGRELRLLVSKISAEDPVATESSLGCVIIVEDITDEKVQARSKDEFFSIASHELRTPLTAIRGNTQMIKDFYPEALKDDNLKEMVDDIHVSSVRLIDVVNDFLDVSGLEQGKIVYNCEPFKVLDVVQDVAKDLAEFAKSFNNTIAVDDSIKQSPAIYADKNRVKQVLYNLIGNGMKFTKDESITVRAEATESHLKIFVIDRGQGIPEKNQKLLFRKFQQAGDSIYTRETIKGTGLGLYISKLLVEQMGGQVRLESSVVGKGTTFSFSIPLAKD